MILLEALAMEIPVIAHRVGGIPELLANGDCGWLVVEQTPEAYAEVAARVLEADSEQSAKSRKGVCHVQKTFGLRANTIKYEELYTQQLRE